MLQVFRLTALVVRGPASRGKQFIVSLNRVAIKKKCVVSCSVCRSLFGAHVSHREVSSQIPA